jgi:hypothetical protein
VSVHTVEARGHVDLGVTDESYWDDVKSNNKHKKR